MQTHERARENFPPVGVRIALANSFKDLLPEPPSNYGLPDRMSAAYITLTGHEDWIEPVYEALKKAKAENKIPQELSIIHILPSRDSGTHVSKLHEASVLIILPVRARWEPSHNSGHGMQPADVAIEQAAIYDALVQTFADEGGQSAFHTARLQGHESREYHSIVEQATRAFGKQIAKIAYAVPQPEHIQRHDNPR